MTRAEILEAAKACVCGGREQDYGQPENNFETIGLLWSVYLNAAHPGILELKTENFSNNKVEFENFFTKTDVAMMMALLKIARISAGAGSDSFVDLAGYAACAGEML